MMGAEVYLWWMVVSSNRPEVVPIPYQTQQMCEWAGEEAGLPVRCIPQPAADAAEYAATMAAVKPDVCVLEDGLTNLP